MRLDDDQPSYKRVKYGVDKVILGVDKPSETNEIEVLAKYFDHVPNTLIMCKFIQELGTEEKKKKEGKMRNESYEKKDRR